MTKRIPGRRDGDGSDGGPDETPTERLLREALNARATLVTVHDLRPAAPPGGRGRMRRLKPVYLATAPLLALAAALAIGVLGFRADMVADRQRNPDPAATLSASPTPTPLPTPEPSPTATATDGASPAAVEETEPPETADPPGAAATTTAAAGPATPYTFRGVRFKVPSGWRVVPPDPESESLCVLSPGAPRSATAADCSPYGAMLTVHDRVPELWPSQYFLLSRDGWGSQPSCPVWGNPNPGDPAKPPMTDTYAVTRDIVAGRAAYKAQWHVTCNAKESFTAQLWGLPRDQVFLSAIGMTPEYQPGLVSILDTLDVSSHPVPPTPSYKNDVSVTVSGLATAQQVSNNGAETTVSVTFKNTGTTDYAKIQPVFVAEDYAGSPGGSVPRTAGTLQREDPSGWTTLPLGEGDGKERASMGEDAAFPLAPGQSRTVKYRMKLTREDGAGVLPVTVSAVRALPGTQEYETVGERSVPVRVVAR
ncbi:hypothetical protein ACWEQL_22280 [Kitasatospora sp. NPDC004240]